MSPKPPTYTYRAILDGEQYRFISFYKWSLNLHRTNHRPVHCGRCAAQFPVGMCVKHLAFHDNWFICIDCARNLILHYGRHGFFVNLLLNLQASFETPGKYPAQQVADSITRLLLTFDPNGLEILSNPINDILG